MQLLTESTTEYREEQKKLKEEQKKKTAEDKKATDAVKEQADAYQELLDRLDPVSAALNRVDDDFTTLHNQWLTDAEMSYDEYQEILDKLAESTREAGDGIAEGIVGALDIIEQKMDGTARHWVGAVGDMASYSAENFTVGADGSISMGEGGTAGAVGAAGVAVTSAYAQANPESTTASGVAMGAQMGTAIMPGWGTLIGAIVGGVIGHSQKKSTRAEYVQVGGQLGEEGALGAVSPRGGWEDRVSVTSAFGVLGISDLGSKDIDAQQFQPQLESIAEMDDALAEAFGPEQTARVREAIAGWTRGDRKADEFSEIMRERAIMIFEHIDHKWSDIALAVNNTSEEIFERMIILKNLDDLFNTDPIEGFEAAMERANRTMRERLYDNANAVGDLAAVFDGSTESLRSMGEAVRSHYEMELTYIARLADAQTLVTDTLASSIENIQLSVMDTATQYEYFTDQAEALAASIATMTDAEDIEDAVARLNELTNRSYGLLGEEQQQDVSGEFVDFLEGVMETANNRLGELREEATTDMEMWRTTMEQVIDYAREALAVNAEQTQAALDSVNEIGQGITESAAIYDQIDVPALLASLHNRDEDYELN